MSQKPAASAKAMMDEVERLRAEHGVYPAPRAVRTKMKGSQERADQAILAVKILNGTSLNLRSTLPDEFQAELPPASEMVMLTSDILASLPEEVRDLASDLVSALGAAYRKQVEYLTGRAVAAEKRRDEETKEMHAQLLEASRALDAQERDAEQAMQDLRNEVSGLRVEVGTLAAKLAAKETELEMRVETHDALLTQAREAAATADTRHATRISELEEDLKIERATCRTAEQQVARLTATNEAMLAELDRRDAASKAEQTRRDDERSSEVTGVHAVPPRLRRRKVTEAAVGGV